MTGRAGFPFESSENIIRESTSTRQKWATGELVVGNSEDIVTLRGWSFLFSPNVFRYDGLYKVVKYFPQKGKSGFSVWRYCLRRDDPAPAPWTKEGQERIAALGLVLICPEGYEPDGEKDKEKDKKTRKAIDALPEDDGVFDEERPKKKPKREAYKLEDKLVELIEQDVLNTKVWEECRAVLSDGKTAFLKRVSDR